ncbi:glycoside hydrolase family 43 protein [Saccharobesus litoralis]|nr:family 43 glycosylhydrolase [Saccharobesus litoralis]
MKNTKTKLMAALCLTIVWLSACAPNSTPNPENKTKTQSPTLNSFTYQNPIKVADDEIRDPTILKYQNKYYLTATGRKQRHETVNIWVSGNLTQWVHAKTIAKVGEPVTWCTENLWAPELRHYDGKFYITFNCPTSDIPRKRARGGALLVADEILGDYQVLTADKPIASPNDTHLFKDDDGKVYSVNTGGWLTQVDLNTGKPIGERKQIYPFGEKGNWDARLNEGPALFKRNGKYYLWVVGKYLVGDEIGIGLATADNIWGPYTKDSRNPIFGSSLCNQTQGCPYDELNHCHPFEGPDGKDWFSCFAKFNSGPNAGEHLYIDRMIWSDNGQLNLNLSWQPQTVEW